MNIKRNIVFSLESRKKNGVAIVENVPIRMRVIYNGQRVEFTTGYRIDVAKWDLDKQRVKNGCTNKLKQSASEINADLLKYYTDIQEIFKEFEVQDIVPTPQQLKDAFNDRYKQPEPEPKLEEEEIPQSVILDKAFKQFIKECGTQNSWGNATYEKFAAVKNHLNDFDKNLSFETLTESKLMEYVNYLRCSLDMRNTTIEKQISYLKWFLRWSTKKRVRDVFLFSCFTGLRHSDIYNLRKSDIKENHIEITTIKTADSLIIDLNNHSKAVLDKYKDVHFENDKALPVISNQKMNDYLKELAELAEINEPVRETYYKGSERIEEVTPKYALLGTHAGRRTFICNALSLGIPPQVVMKWTGHNDYKAMRPYIDIADDIRANAMDKFNQL
jgi:integrase